MDPLRQLRVALPRLYAADVGSAGGLSEHWRRVAAWLDVDAFEPDAEECARQRAVAAANVRWHAVGLARTSGKHKLYVLNRSTGSSLYPPNQEQMARYSTPSYHGLRTVVDVDCLSFPDFWKRDGRPVPQLIKLDTQGSELDILAGIGDDAWPEILAVETEIEFAELYKGQPLFCDVQRFMADKGFELLDLRTHRAYRCHAGVEGYFLRKHFNFAGGSDQVSARLVAGDALYVRPLPADKVPRERLLRQFMIFVAYHYYEDALLTLERGLTDGALTRDEATGLQRLTLALGPRPRVLQRSDLLGNVARRVWRRLGRNGEYRTFWTSRSLPDQ